ncbi:MAG TPA: hypothetical protein VMZ71_14855 [Gemmataceae bacterium]|nr:hypothetical protein [Gemmataceae bacterium]
MSPRRLALLLLLAATAPGCAALAKETPTPAAKIDRKELAQRHPPPNERYYVMIFGSESKPKRAKTTHTWATLVTATDVPGSAEPHLDVQTISWLPETLDIKPLRFRVEPGKNFDLDTTIAESLRTDQEITMWGPYEVWHGLAHRVRVQKDFLDSGVIGYQCIDSIGESAWTGLGSDCIHAIADMDPNFGRTRYPLIFFGRSASANIVRRLMSAPAIINPPATHDWIIPRLGLDRYPITRGTYNGPVTPHSREAVIELADRLGR